MAAQRGSRPATAAAATAAVEEPVSAPVDPAPADQAPVHVVRLAPATTAAAGPYPGGYAIATADLRVAGGARAHLAGDRVPAGNIDRNGWQDDVRPPVDGE